MSADLSQLYFIGGCVVVLCFYPIAANAERRIRGWYSWRKIEKAWAARPKAPVRKIGYVTTDCMGQTHFIDFHFEATRGVPMYQHGPRGEFVIMGWEERELREFAQRRAEFE